MPTYRHASQFLSENSDTLLFLGAVQELSIPSKLKPALSDSQLHPAQVWKPPGTIILPQHINLLGSISTFSTAEIVNLSDFKFGTGIELWAALD